jgi:mono/diheme cytochrome c family protein
MFKFLLFFLSTMSFGIAASFGAELDSSQLFLAKCASCHGQDGKGSAKMAKMLKVDISQLDLTGKTTVKATDGELTKVTSEGLKKMPKFQDKLMAGQIEALVKYIRTLAPPKK